MQRLIPNFTSNQRWHLTEIGRGLLINMTGQVDFKKKLDPKIEILYQKRTRNIKDDRCNIYICVIDTFCGYYIFFQMVYILYRNKKKTAELQSKSVISSELFIGC
jgi:hypothetical protein